MKPSVSGPIQKGRDWLSRGGKCLKARVRTRDVNLCRHRGCPKEEFPCHSASGNEEGNGHHCFKHCSEYRFCHSFGFSWEAMGFFDLRNGHCVNGRKDLRPESGGKKEERLKYYQGELPQEASHCDPFPEKMR